MILVFSKSWPQSLPKIRFLGQLKRLVLEKNCLFWRWEIGKMWIVEIWGDFDECCRVSGKVLGFLVGRKG